MKTIQISQYGGPEILQINKNTQKPALKKGQVLVENYAASINPFDYKIRSGAYRKMIPLSLPVTMGGDFAGTVMEIGEGVNDFKIGDQVYGQAIVLNGGSGAFAEYVASNTENMAKKPKNTNFEEAAALPL